MAQVENKSCLFFLSCYSSLVLESLLILSLVFLNNILPNMPPAIPPAKPAIGIKRKDPRTSVNKKTTKKDPVKPAIEIPIASTIIENIKSKNMKDNIADQAPELKPPLDAKPPAKAPINQIPRIKNIIPVLSNGKPSGIPKSISKVFVRSKISGKFIGKNTVTTNKDKSATAKCPLDPCPKSVTMYSLNARKFSGKVGNSIKTKRTTTIVQVMKPIRVLYIFLRNIILMKKR